MWSKAFPKRRIRPVAVASRAIEASVMGEGEGSGGDDGGQGRVPPVGGSKGPEPLASPNVLHWVGWLPGTTRCAAGPAVPASHGAPPRRTRAVQVEGPAVPETEIGAGGVPGCSGMPGAWKSQPARQSSRIPGAGHGRTPWRLRCRHGEDRPIGAGKPGLERPRNDRRFPPPGVKDVASYGWPPFTRGVAHTGGSLGGARF